MSASRSAVGTGGPGGRRGRGRDAHRSGRAQVRPADPGRPAQPAAAHAEVQALTPDDDRRRAPSTARTPRRWPRWSPPGLRDVPDFPQPGVVFKDITPLLADPRAFAAVVEATPPAATTVPVDLVAGIEARGFVVGAALAHALGVGFVPVRKAGKLPGPDRVDLVRPGVRLGRDRGARRRASSGASGCCSSTTSWPPAARPPRPGTCWSAPAPTSSRSSASSSSPSSTAGPGWVAPGGSAPRRPVTGRLHSGHGGGHHDGRGRDTPPPGVSSRARARAALALVGRNRLPENPVLEPLLQVVRSTHPKADLALDRAGVRRRRARPRGPEAPLGRRLHHPPARGDDDPRRARHDPDHAGGRPAPRHRRGHRLQPRGAAPRLRRRDRDARRRRHQARQGHLRPGRAGRDGAQDGRRDGARHPGARHQARRPAAQRPHLAVRLAGERPAQGEGDPRDLRAAGPPPGHEHHQVGARGPVLPGPLPQGLRRDRPARRRARPGPRGVPRRRCARRSAPTCARRRSRRRSPAGPSTTTPSTRR